MKISTKQIEKLPGKKIDFGNHMTLKVLSIVDGWITYTSWTSGAYDADMKCHIPISKTFEQFKYELSSYGKAVSII